MIKLPFLVADCSCGLFEVEPCNFHAGTWGTFTARTKLYFVHCGGKWWYCLQNVVKFILPTKFTLICFHDYNKLTDRNAVPRESLPDDPALVICKVCNESWVQQLTPFDSWTLTAGILLSKVIFFSIYIINHNHKIICLDTLLVGIFHFY